MDIVEVSKVLSNKTRVDILDWLKSPDDNFPPHKELGHFDFGVCGQFIQEKCGLSQSTISHYLSMMIQADLLIATRIGKWTYYQRNEEKLEEYRSIISKL
ncbi:MAG: transcriptional regulator [bacterium]|nr:transcriptional regulator [bacterium]